MNARAWLPVMALLLAACGGKVVFEGQGGAGGASQDAGAGGGPGCLAGGLTLPAAMKACSVPSDCTFGLAYLDCCGSQIALGVNKSELDAFATYQKECNTTVPACGCPAEPTVTERGESGPNDAVLASCKDGVCFSFIPAPPPPGGG